MSTLNVVSIVASFCSIAINSSLVLRPSLPGWDPRTVRIAGAITALLALATIIMTLKNSR